MGLIPTMKKAEPDSLLYLEMLHCNGPSIAAWKAGAVVWWSAPVSLVVYVCTNYNSKSFALLRGFPTFDN